MPTNYKVLSFACLLAVTQASCSGSKVTQQQQPAETVKTENTEKSENTDKKKPAPKSGIKRYSEVITSEAVSDKGVFTIHKVGDKYFYEIPDSLLQRDFLWISRFANLPSGLGGAM